MKRMQAALVGAREITFAALAASLAILAIFVPVIFMEGVIGRYFYQFGITISVAVIFSLLEALTVTPMRCSQFLVVGHHTWLGKWVDGLMRRLSKGYSRALTFCLDRRKAVLIIATMIFAASLIS